MAEEKNVLRVKMLGSFSMSFRGQPLLGAKSSNTQFAYLMQMLLHKPEQGIGRDVLEETLFGDRDVENTHRALRSVIYNAKKRLEEMGLPKADYIVRRDEMLFWTDEIPVWEDASVFEQLYMEAQREREEEQRLQLLLAACHCYTGEFLELYSNFLWVASEARRYRGMFYGCVEEAAALLRKRQNFLEMKELGIYASRIAPFCDWETVTMEALVGLGSYKEAVELYTITGQRYLEERGLRPSQKLLEMLERLGDQVTHPSGSLDSIRKNLEEDGNQDGPYMCSYPVFRGIYHMMKRMRERYRQPITLMLCTIVDSKGNPMRESSQFDKLSERLVDVIRLSVRKSDVVSRYSCGQYLILFPNASRENCVHIQKRINEGFLQGRQRTGLRFYVTNLQE